VPIKELTCCRRPAVKRELIAIHFRGSTVVWRPLANTL